MYPFHYLFFKSMAEGNPVEGSRGLFDFLPKSLNFDEEEVVPEAGWERIPQAEVLNNRGLPLILVRIPKSNVESGDKDFVASVYSRDMPEGSSGEFFLETIPATYIGKDSKGLSEPGPGERAGFLLPLVNNIPFNRQFFIKLEDARARVLFKIEPDDFAFKWNYTIPPYAYPAKNTFRMAVDDGHKNRDGMPVLNVRVFRPKNIDCKVCGNVAEKRCKVCKTAYYCGVECRNADWHKHKYTCRN